jgi:microcystin-dependent protein
MSDDTSDAGREAPSLVMRQLVAVNGDYPKQGGTSPAINTLGMVHSFAGTFEAYDTRNADSKPQRVIEVQALVALIGTTYGGDGGGLTIQLPNLGDIVAVGGRPGQAEPARTLAMTYLIAATPGSAWPVPGAIGLFAGDFAPSGWHKANGWSLMIDQHPALYGAIGTTFGGDGRDAFVLPDLNGRAAIGAGARRGLPSIAPGEIVDASRNGGIAALGLNYIICLDGDLPPHGSGTLPSGQAFLGQVIAFAGAAIPNGWALARGQLLPVNSNGPLYALIGTTYGGDGENYFALPDLRGRMIVGPVG